MTQNHPVPTRKRSRVSERARLQAEAWSSPAQDEAQPSVPQEADYSAYYRREGVEQDAMDEPAYAAPVTLNPYFGTQNRAAAQEETPQVYGAAHAYQPLSASWVDDEQLDADEGYHVREDVMPPKRQKRSSGRIVLLVVSLLALVGGAAVLLREPMMAWLQQKEILPSVTDEPFAAIVTPQPVKAYDVARSADISDTTAQAIAELAGDTAMEAYIVTDEHIVTRNLRADGTYDFYLFTADRGRLLCYFEGLEASDMLAQADGTFFVEQAPYLIAPSGAALIGTADVERRLGESVRLQPMYHGWAVARGVGEGGANYIDQSGQVLSALWFCRTFPFTGDYTLAYADTGATAEASQRYLLYVVGADGTTSRWLATPDWQDVIGVVCGMAYMRGGALYRLPDTSAPLLHTAHVDAYPDCDALVVQDRENGKYGLLVHGEQHYDFEYDRIAPVESDMPWQQGTLQGEGGRLVVHTVQSPYPQVLSHAFVLEKDGQCEYVALSTESPYAIRLQDVLGTEGMQ